MIKQIAQAVLLPHMRVAGRLVYEANERLGWSNHRTAHWLIQFSLCFIVIIVVGRALDADIFGLIVFGGWLIATLLVNHTMAFFAENTDAAFEARERGETYLVRSDVLQKHLDRMNRLTGISSLMGDGLVGAFVSVMLLISLPFQIAEGNWLTVSAGLSMIVVFSTRLLAIFAWGFLLPPRRRKRKRKLVASMNPT